jgi:dienelactone hydrolase
MGRLIGALVLVAAAGSTTIAAVTVIDHVVITSRDGVALKGTYFSPGRPGPGIVLFHQCDGAGRGSWGTFPRELAAAGFHVLTFDNRGIGESARGRQAPDTVAGDAEAAYSWLAWQQGVDNSRLAAGGSSCGVANATNLTMTHADLRALVLISGGVGTNAMAQIRKTPNIAILGIGGEGDPLVSNLAAAVQASKDARSTMKIYAGSTHGVSLFVKNRELPSTIVQWLEIVMK